MVSLYLSLLFFPRIEEHRDLEILVFDFKFWNSFDANIFLVFLHFDFVGRSTMLLPLSNFGLFMRDSFHVSMFYNNPKMHNPLFFDKGIIKYSIHSTKDL